MIYKITTKVLGGRSAFGYTHSGKSSSAGKTSGAEAIDFLDRYKKMHDWSYLTWHGDDMTVEFEDRNDGQQIIEEVLLIPEWFGEYALLKKWETDNGFV